MSLLSLDGQDEEVAPADLPRDPAPCPHLITPDWQLNRLLKY